PALIVKARDRGSDNAVLGRGACSWPRFSFRSLSISLRTTRHNSERDALSEAKAGQGALKRPPGHVSEDRNAFRREGRPRLILCQIGDASRDSLTTINIGDVRERGPKLICQEGEMSAGQDDRVDPVAVEGV